MVFAEVRRGGAGAVGTLFGANENVLYGWFLMCRVVLWHAECAQT